MSSMSSNHHQTTERVMNNRCFFVLYIIKEVAPFNQFAHRWCDNICHDTSSRRSSLLLYWDDFSTWLNPCVYNKSINDTFSASGLKNRVDYSSLSMHSFPSSISVDHGVLHN
ncbi:hypothetical protein MLD38_021262 [Melastoma candidum]|uniref:Uncharacterized protein n=1 Tax=Melastoma candidum TaxID=119954 RepID=A0ACB9QEZ4_9MYRT|nr:hypothetical protein MLD38_021262 [Melastoma candidum]